MGIESKNMDKKPRKGKKIEPSKKTLKLNLKKNDVQTMQRYKSQEIQHTQHRVYHKIIENSAQD